ncbi:MAG: amino acid ABC transporter permease [Treponema sp.]|jgi:His/Glu/Gln/Arg/opine family amino acid ABC transporter permease subunit|nr:amino acid ABC transporter permease [Treponema sp.]
MNFFSWSFFAVTLFRIIGRVPVTLGITVGAFSVGLVLAFILAAVQLYKVPAAWQAARFYISFIRGTPILIQLLICNLLLPGLIWRITGYNAGRYWPPIVFVILAYALNSAAFLSETLRASVSGVGAGQQEAAYSVGLTKLQSLVHVILPQAIRISIPGIANSLSSLLKDTSLAYSAAGILDIMGMASTNATASFRGQSGAVLNATFREMEGYIGAACVFFVLCLLLERGMNLLSKRLDQGGGYTPSQTRG